MLQIIGWLGCFYLVIKALEIGSSSAHVSEDGELRKTAIAAMWLAVLGAAAFAIWLLDQGAAASQPY